MINDRLCSDRLWHLFKATGGDYQPGTVLLFLQISQRSYTREVSRPSPLFWPPLPLSSILIDPHPFSVNHRCTDCCYSFRVGDRPSPLLAQSIYCWCAQRLSSGGNDCLPTCECCYLPSQYIR